MYLKSDVEIIRQSAVNQTNSVVTKFVGTKCIGNKQLRTGEKIVKGKSKK